MAGLLSELRAVPSAILRNTTSQNTLRWGSARLTVISDTDPAI